MKDPRDHILDLSQAVLWRQALRARGLTLAVTNGCFDILHRGHLETLLQARRKADALLVLLNSDLSVRALKGPGRPVQDEHARAFALASLRLVDQVVIFETPRCAAELRALEPDLYVKSAEYQTLDALDPDERAALGEHCPIVLLRPVDAVSTTAILARGAATGLAAASPNGDRGSQPRAPAEVPA